MKKLNLIMLAILAITIPVGTFYGLGHASRPLRTLDEPFAHIGFRFPESPMHFHGTEIGPPVEYRPLITNVQILDFDQDGRSDILACDSRRQCLVLLRQTRRRTPGAKTCWPRTLPRRPMPRSSISTATATATSWSRCWAICFPTTGSSAN